MKEKCDECSSDAVYRIKDSNGRVRRYCAIHWQHYIQFRQKGKRSPYL